MWCDYIEYFEYYTHIMIILPAHMSFGLTIFTIFTAAAAAATVAVSDFVVLLFQLAIWSCMHWQRGTFTEIVQQIDKVYLKWKIGDYERYFGYLEIRKPLLGLHSDQLCWLNPCHHVFSRNLIKCGTHRKRPLLCKSQINSQNRNRWN